MKLFDWLDAHWEPENILAPEMDAADAGSVLVDELLPGFYVTYPCNAKQALTEIVAAVVAKYKPKPSLWRRILNWLSSAAAQVGGINTGPTLARCGPRWPVRSASPCSRPR
jgi:hypothetical protein